jgi:stage V sporulation protein B
MAQAFILAAAAIITRVMGFLYKLPIINMIGDEGIGIYGMGGVVYNFFYILSSAGLPAAVSRMVSARLALKQNGNAHEVFKVSLKFALIIGLMSSLVLFFGAGFFFQSD